MKNLKIIIAANENSFILTSNIVKALFIKLPVETPNLYRIKSLARSNKQKDLQELESLVISLPKNLMILMKNG